MPELPGPMSARLLGSLDIAHRVDEQSNWILPASQRPPDRARVVRQLVPQGVQACLWLAVWIWIGGEFPDELDIITTSHYRKEPCRRSLRVHNRIVRKTDIVVVHRMPVTTPLRTACDLACLDDNAFGYDVAQRDTAIGRIMHINGLSPHLCLLELCRSGRSLGRAEGVAYFTRMCKQEEERLHQLSMRGIAAAASHIERAASMRDAAEKALIETNRNRLPVERE